MDRKNKVKFTIQLRKTGMSKNAIAFRGTRYPFFRIVAGKNVHYSDFAAHIQEDVYRFFYPDWWCLGKGYIIS